MASEEAIAAMAQAVEAARPVTLVAAVVPVGDVGAPGDRQAVATVVGELQVKANGPG